MDGEAGCCAEWHAVSSPLNFRRIRTPAYHCSETAIRTTTSQLGLASRPRTVAKCPKRSEQNVLHLAGHAHRIDSLVRSLSAAADYRH